MALGCRGTWPGSNTLLFLVLCMCNRAGKGETVSRKWLCRASVCAYVGVHVCTVGVHA
jgi:hypothetical protein